jgi:hypothetical protein
MVLSRGGIADDGLHDHLPAVSWWCHWCWSCGDPSCAMVVGLVVPTVLLFAVEMRAKAHPLDDVDGTLVSCPCRRRRRASPV